MAVLMRKSSFRNGTVVCTFVTAIGSAVAAGPKAGNARIDAADCASFTVADAGLFIGVPSVKVIRKIEKLTQTLVTCSYAAGTALPGAAFSIEVASTARAAAEDMERYRANLELAGETRPWKGKLPKGAYCDIVGPGLGDDAVWTDINGVLTVRKANVTPQITQPVAKLDQLRLAQAVLAKF